MNTAVVLEGPTDVSVFERLLEVAASENVKFYSASGESYADSLARSLLGTGTERLALIVDADSQNSEVVEDRKRFLEGSLGKMASRSRFHVVVIVPEIEAIFFADRDLVEKLLQKPISEEDFITGRYEPKPILSRHLGKRTLKEAFEALGEEELTKLRGLPEISSLIHFLREPVKAEARRKKTPAVAESRAGYRGRR